MREKYKSKGPHCTFNSGVYTLLVERAYTDLEDSFWFLSAFLSFAYAVYF